MTFRLAMKNGEIAAEIPLRGVRRGEASAAYCDIEMWHILSQSKWHIGTDGYARRKARKKERQAGSPFFIAMHREVLGIHMLKGKPGIREVDHANGDRRDNRKRNLRVVDRSHNSINRRKRAGDNQFVGVNKHVSGLWNARVSKGRRLYSLGYFKTEIEAAKARDDGAKKLYGNHAVMNLEERHDQ